MEMRTPKHEKIWNGNKKKKKVAERYSEFNWFAIQCNLHHFTMVSNLSQYFWQTKGVSFSLHIMCSIYDLVASHFCCCNKKNANAINLRMRPNPPSTSNNLISMFIYCGLRSENSRTKKANKDCKYKSRSSFSIDNDSIERRLNCTEQWHQTFDSVYVSAIMRKNIDWISINL